jgi:hypothetical protein
MRALVRLADGLRRFSGRPIRCPRCGREGYDGGGEHEAFERRGFWGIHPVRKCLSCGEGLLIKGHRFEPIPSDRWRALEARWAEARDRP